MSGSTSEERARPWTSTSRSWKQRDRVRALAEALRAAGHDVFDFTAGHATAETHPPKWDPTAWPSYRAYLQSWPDARHEIVRANRDRIRAADVTLLLLPAGADAHAEWAYAVGRSKWTAIVGVPAAGELTATHPWADDLVDHDDQVVIWLAKLAAEDGDWAIVRGGLRAQRTR